MPRLGWRREGGYEAHMKTPEFEAALSALAETASGTRTAFMCPELKWRERHRSFIAEALHKSGREVVHIHGGSVTETRSVLPLL